MISGRDGQDGMGRFAAWFENATFTSEDFLKKYPNEVKKFEVEKFVATRYQVYKTV
jgi:hypothetical protein